ncbi:hypothetical protein GWK47_016393 [Chionoecetes opilio]|uniref:Uncharacterized protein n=1 Tax=Chionoecetes opilio TaxID=41210 RepID=A0A8J4XSI1_CHIOP|nr:hypothetical protein GWK47_016393 [Chionoecetes opilio]
MMDYISQGFVQSAYTPRPAPSPPCVSSPVPPALPRHPCRTPSRGPGLSPGWAGPGGGAPGQRDGRRVTRGARQTGAGGRGRRRCRLSAVICRVSIAGEAPLTPGPAPPPRGTPPHPAHDPGPGDLHKLLLLHHKNPGKSCFVRYQNKPMMLPILGSLTELSYPN